MQITATLLSSLRLVISQRLIPLADGSGRTALREFLVFTPHVREVLLDVPPEQLIQRTEELLDECGQSIQKAAHASFTDGRIDKAHYLAIMAERETAQEQMP